MKKPVFTDTMQIGIVVRDLDATIKRYEDDYGIGHWQFYEVKPENAPDLRLFGGTLRVQHDARPPKLEAFGGKYFNLSAPKDNMPGTSLKRLTAFATSP
jgi:hypothetical protein